MEYLDNGSPRTTWTCKYTDCNTCVGSFKCNALTLTVSNIEGDGSGRDLPRDCKYGDTVKMESRGSLGIAVAIQEMAIIGKKGIGKLINY